VHDDHIDPEVFASACHEYGELSGKEAFAAHLHLIEGCAECVEGILDYFGLESFEELAALEEPSSEFAKRLQRREAEPLLSWLGTLSNEEQFGRVISDRRFHTASMAKALLRRCRSRWGSEPRAALLDSHLALVAAGKIQSSGGSLPLGGLSHMKAQVWAHQGNVWRILFDFPAAETAFDQAQAVLKEGNCDDLILAQVLRYRSGLWRAQRRFRWAMVAIDRAIQLYRRAQSWQQQGEAFLISAKLRSDAGEAVAAERELNSAMQLLNLDIPTKPSLVAASLKLDLLWRTGRFVEADGYLPEARIKADDLGCASDQLRIEWCAASIAAGLGNTDEAEALFNEVRDGFLDLDSAYDVALVSLELAQLYAEQERYAEIQELASEMIPIFQSREIHRETLAAVKLFADAVRGEEEEHEAIGQLSAYLANARHDPSLRYSS